MNLTTVVKSASALALFSWTAAVLLGLTSLASPVLAEAKSADSNAKASASGAVHHKHAPSKPEDPEAELRKELNLPEAPVIHGFHPIKQTMGEISEIESINVRLYEEIKKLQLPVASLQPTMLQLQNTMLHVDGQMDITHKQLSSVGEQMDAMHKQMGIVGDRMGTVGDRMGAVSDKMGTVQQQIGRVGDKMDAMRDQLLSVGQKMDGMHGKLGGVEGQIKQMEAGMAGLREDLSSIRTDLTAVRTQVEGLTKPIQQIREPLTEVAGPLGSLAKRLDQLQTLVTYVLMAIILATVGIAIGTPLAAFIIHKRHGGLFYPTASAVDKELSTKV